MVNTKLKIWLHDEYLNDSMIINRYYWDMNLDNCVVRMSNSVYIYGYEYLGASPRLVITPLTDRYYNMRYMRCIFCSRMLHVTLSHVNIPAAFLDIFSLFSLVYLYADCHIDFDRA